jgi:hypothetical protein
MAEPTDHHEAEPRATSTGGPPSGGRQDHEAMRQGAMRPVSGPAATDDLAASGGLEIPGRERHPEASGAPAGPVQRELIPGEREIDTLTHREPGAIGGQFTGEDTPAPRRSDWLAEETAIERALEGGGGSVSRARARVERGREP